MDNLSSYTYWFLVAFSLLALEMATGTFYMLMLGIAFGAGGLAALLGFGLPVQILCCAVAGVIGTVILRRNRNARADPPGSQSLDIGAAVQTVKWHDNGTARVQYRGTEWDAEAESAATARDGPLFIKEIRGSTLILSDRKP